jgi:protein phosphatase 2C family protein 2/3
MEDAHAAVLDLDGPEESSNAFFAVYDGHGGEFLSPTILTFRGPKFRNLGSTVSKFACQNVHKRLVTEESYKERNWEMALKKAFLGTDEDFLAGTHFPFHLMSLRSLFPGKILHI